MRQAMHIFRKDVHQFRIEIALVAAMAAAMVWINPTSVPYVIPAQSLNFWFGFPWAMLFQTSAAVLIFRVVHAEAIPGDRQFWVTRPYRWQSLLAAKVFFIAVFVHLPLALLQLAIVGGAGFPIAPNLNGLLWAQLLEAAVVTLPAAVIASVTASAVGFALSALAIFAGAALFGRRVPTMLGGVEWTRTILATAVLSLLLIPLLVWQYRRRASIPSRIWLTGTIAAAALTYALFPWQLAFAAQFHSAPQASLRFTVDAADKRLIHLENTATQAEVDIPMIMHGAPDLSVFRADALSVTFERPDGRTFTAAPQFSEQLGPYPQDGQMLYFLTVKIDRSFLTADPATLRGAFYYTLFGNIRDVKLAYGKTAQITPDYQCLSPKNVLGWMSYCRSAFRPSPYVVDAYTNREIPPGTVVSYSPLPSGFVTAPLWGQPTFVGLMGPQTAERSIRIKEPVAHIRQDFEVPNVVLTDFASPR